jgi:hypothetical protein
MTTPNKFFEKIFNENDKVVNGHFYTSQSFIDYSEKEIKFLKYLSFYSRYKNFIKNYFIHKNVRNTDKRNYLDIYKQTMSYEEYIEFNTITDNLQVSYQNCVYLFGTFFAMGYLFYTYKSPNIYIGGKEIAKVFLLSLLLSLSYYKYNYINYNSKLDQIYKSVSKRINDNPELKLRPNSDFFEGESDDTPHESF